MLADCSRWDAECAGTAAERDGTKSLNPRRAALAWNMSARNKGLYGHYSQDSLHKALNAIKRGASYGAASKDFGVPKSTLKDHAKGRSTLGKKAGCTTSIPIEIENKIVEKVMDAANAGFPWTKRQILIRVGLIVKKWIWRHSLRKTCHLKSTGIHWKGGTRSWPSAAPNHVAQTGCGVWTQFLSTIILMTWRNSGRSMTVSKPQVVWNADETGVQFSPDASKVIP